MGFFPLRLVNFAKNLCLNFLFLIIVVPNFFCGQNSLLDGQFWAVGRLDLLSGHINLRPPVSLLFTSLLELS